MTDLTDRVPLVLPDGDDLALSRGTDFFHIGDLLDERERAVLYRVRTYCDTQVAPVANDYWERAEFPCRSSPATASCTSPAAPCRATAAPACPPSPKASSPPNWPAATAASPPSTPSTPAWP